MATFGCTTSPVAKAHFLTKVGNFSGVRFLCWFMLLRTSTNRINCMCSPHSCRLAVIQEFQNGRQVYNIEKNWRCIFLNVLNNKKTWVVCFMGTFKISKKFMKNQQSYGTLKFMQFLSFVVIWRINSR